MDVTSTTAPEPRPAGPGTGVRSGRTTMYGVAGEFLGPPLVVEDRVSAGRSAGACQLSPQGLRLHGVRSAGAVRTPTAKPVGPKVTACTADRRRASNGVAHILSLCSNYSMSTKKVAGTRPRAASGAKSQATRGRILDAALQLFNEQGTAAVSTNHIAAAAGLSPGNLYYHFADKKEIVRELHARYAAAHEDRWPPAPDGRAGLATLRRSVTEGAALAWRYRFFERERLALLRTDPRLRADYREVYEQRLGQWLEFAEQLVAHGLVRPPRPPGTLRRLGIAVWLIAENWLAFLDVVGDPQDPDQVAEGADLILVALEPHLTALGRRQWQASAPGQSQDGSSGKRDVSHAGEPGGGRAPHRPAGEE